MIMRKERERRVEEVKVGGMGRWWRCVEERDELEKVRVGEGMEMMVE